MSTEVIGPMRIVRPVPVRKNTAETCRESPAGIEERIKALAKRELPLFSESDRNTAEERGEVVRE